MHFPSCFREKTTRATSSAAGLLLVTLALGVGAPLGHAAAKRNSVSVESEPRCRFLRVRGRRDDGRLRFWRFSATDILDLELVVGLPFRLEGEHRVDVELYTPDGHLYRTLTVVYGDESAARSSAPARKKLSDLARPVEVQRVERSRLAGASTVRAVLPVAGTAIVASSLYGRWTAVAHLDGGVEACVAPRQFLLTE